jgi:hypothetical protein
MKIDELQKKLLAGARCNPPSDRVPYAFEQRVMAHLRSPTKMDKWTLWSMGLWRAAAPCVAIMLLTGIWAYFAADSNASGDPLAVVLENTVLASLDSAGESW